MEDHELLASFRSDFPEFAMSDWNDAAVNRWLGLAEDYA